MSPNGCMQIFFVGPCVMDSSSTSGRMLIDQVLSLKGSWPGLPRSVITNIEQPLTPGSLGYNDNRAPSSMMEEWT